MFNPPRPQTQISRPASVSETAALGAQIAHLEARCEHLNRAGQALKRSLTSLSTQPDLDDFLRQVFAEVADNAEAQFAGLFLYEAASDTLRLHMRRERGGKVTFGAVLGDPPDFFVPFAADTATAPAFSAALRERDLMFQTLDAPDSSTRPDFIDWHRTQGHVSIGMLALFAGEVPLGLLTLAWKDRQTMTSEQHELILAMANQASLAIELNRLQQAAKQEATQGAVLQERARYARELHDTLAQALTGIVIHQEAAKLFVPDSSEAAPHIRDTLDLAREGLREARLSLWQIRFGALEDVKKRASRADANADYAPPIGAVSLDKNLGDEKLALTNDSNTLCGALLRLAGKIERTAKTSVRISLDGYGHAFELPAQVEDDCLRIAQESTTNAIRHAGARHIRIELVSESRILSLHIEDDGCGFDAEALDWSATGQEWNAERGFGLAGMRERALLHGGKLIVSSSVGAGTRVSATIPIFERADARKGGEARA